jgi:hypothetical protein
MTQEEKRIKLAEVAGWEVIELTLCNVKPDKNGDPEIEPIAPLPDYFNDLNAVHELEETLVKDMRALWMINLCKLTDDSFWATTRATATQRAEALGLTLNLWK